MKKNVGVVAIFLALTLLIGVVFGSQPASAVDNFTITNFAVDMELGKDAEGRSTLRTVETITADFPQTNENRGLERQFVKTYNDHGTSFKLLSVTDENDTDLSYHWNGDTLRIGDADTFVHGLTTYKITYTQRDITRQYQDTNKDEFYWDSIGTEWRVPIESASLRLKLAPDIRSAAETDLQCYYGQDGSTARCQSSEEDDTYLASVENIGNYSGMTVALGFTSGTFAEYQPSLLERLLSAWIAITVITALASVVVIIWALIRAHKWTYRDNEMGTIIPEYLPPKNASVAVSASVLSGHHATLAAELTDLAVRHYIQILETREKSFLRAAEYDIKVVKDISDLRAEEKEILSDMFGHTPKVDERLALKTLRNNTTVYTRFSDNDKKITKLLRETYNFKEKNEVKRAWFEKLARFLLAFAILTFSPFLFTAWIVVFILSKTLWVLSDEGLALRRYLKGLEMYIKVAEKDRLKMLQSPGGAEKIAIKDVTDPAQLVKLYEKVLPYAILFRQEKEWSKRLGDYYESTDGSPDWYSGNMAFNAVVFSSMMTNFSNSVSTTSASSSSSGGSSGGGSSGGGGGGGGGGGW